jgi:hypothetical protein
MSEEEIEDLKRRAERLRREIERHNRLYHEAAPEIPDQEFDAHCATSKRSIPSSRLRIPRRSESAGGQARDFRRCGMRCPCGPTQTHVCWADAQPESRASCASEKRILNLARSPPLLFLPPDATNHRSQPVKSPTTGTMSAFCALAEWIYSVGALLQ